MTNTISEDDTQAISGGIGQGDGENFSGSEIKIVAVEVVAQQKV